MGQARYAVGMSVKTGFIEFRGLMLGNKKRLHARVQD